MLGLIFSIIMGLMSFVYVTVFYLGKTDKIENEYDKIKFARERLTVYARAILIAIKADIEVIYEDEEAFKALSEKDGIVFVSNHSSNLDIPILMDKLPMDIGFVAKKEMENWPFYSQWMKRGGSVFLDRDNPREGIKGIKAAVKLVKEGHPIVIFPQGKRIAGVTEGDFKKGSFKLAVDSKGVVVPITLVGCEKIQKPGSKLIFRNKKVKMIIGKPIYVLELSDEEQKSLNIAVEKSIISIYTKYNVK